MTVSVVEPATPDTEAPSTSLLARMGARARTIRPVDVVAIVALLGVSWWARRSVLPTDGLPFDDAWEAAGASRAGPSDLLAVATNHPGFTAGLMVWARAVSRRSELFALPTFAAGVLAAPVAYAALRSLRIRSLVAAAAALLLVAAPVHVLYSGRVKPYTLETLLGLALIGVLPWLARRRWSAATAVAWAGAAIVVGTTSAFCTVILLGAAAILVLHPVGDRVVRGVAAGVQAVVQVVLLLRVQASFASDQVAEDWETTYDGYIELDDPASVPRQAITHARRLGQAVLDVGSLPAALLVLVAVGGLLVAAWRGDRRVAARFLLLLPALALAGSLVQQVPFGPSVGNPFFPGGRATLWLLPSLVGGLALAADAVVSAVPTSSGRRAASGLALAGAAVAVLVAWPTVVNPGLGSRTTAEVAARAGDDAVVLVLPAGPMSYAAEPTGAMDVRADRDSLQGFVVVPSSPRTHLTTEWDGTLPGLEAIVGDADVVVVLDTYVGLQAAGREHLELILGGLGFEEVGLVTEGASEAGTWRRTA